MRHITCGADRDSHRIVMSSGPEDATRGGRAVNDPRVEASSDSSDLLKKVSLFEKTIDSADDAQLKVEKKTIHDLLMQTPLRLQSAYLQSKLIIIIIIIINIVIRAHVIMH